MKKLILTTVLLVILFYTNTSFSQPKLVIHVTGGYSQPISGLAGDPSELFTIPVSNSAITSPKLYMKLGFNFGGDIKYAFDKKGAFRGVLGFYYSMFSNKYDVAPNQNYPTGTTYKPQFQFFTMSIGAEYAFAPTGKVSPFIGADFTSNFYGGTAMNFNPLYIFASEFKWASGIRNGLQLGAGMDITLNRSRTFGLVVGAKYHLINLIGKSSTWGLEPDQFALVDKEHTQYDELGNSYTVNAINLQSLNFYAGISFFLMQPKRQRGMM
jgi:hypothetical protein